MPGTLLILLMFVAIIYNLGAGLYFMMTDKGESDRTLRALTRRIALSVLLIVLVIIGIWTGLIRPHGIGG
jgi:cytochrome bd-type quinol oxidase subunit 2